MIYKYFVDIIFNIFKIIDYFLIPLMLFLRCFGYRVFIAKTSSYGHHFLEPAIIQNFYKVEKYKKNNKLILLAKRKNSININLNKLFENDFKVIENYNFLSIYYWMARSPIVGISRIKEAKNSNIFFQKKCYEYYNSNIKLNWEFFINDILNKKIYKNLNPQNKKFIIWKPRFRGTFNLRNTSFSSFEKLFLYLEKKDFLVMSFASKHPNFQSKNYIKLNSILSKDILDKFSFFLDYYASYIISGDSGGYVPALILNKPLLHYDIAPPCPVFKGAKRCLCLTKKIRDKRNNKYMSFEKMSQLHFDKLKGNKKLKELKNFQKNYLIENNTQQDLLLAFIELEEKVNLGSDVFDLDDYKINQFYGNNIPKNHYNPNGKVQIADSFFENYSEIFKPIA